MARRQSGGGAVYHVRRFYHVFVARIVFSLLHTCTYTHGYSYTISCIFLTHIASYICCVYKQVRKCFTATINILKSDTHLS